MNGGNNTRSIKNSTQEGMEDLLAALCLSSLSDKDSKKDSEDNTTYPQVWYSDNTEKWVCSDGCGEWYITKSAQLCCIKRKC